MKQVFNFSNWYRLLRLLPALVVLWLPQLSLAQSANVVISQVYPAGGNGGATYNQDFVELFNRSTSPVTITGWTIQYASATGVFGTSNNTYTLTSATIPAGGYYLIGIGTPTIGVGLAFTADQPAAGTTAINSGFAATAGKVALATNATTVTYTAGSGFSANVVDAVGYGSTANAYEGSAAAPSPATVTAAIVRAGSGCTDINNNGNDFASSTVSNPVRNSGTTGSVCTNAVLVANPAALNFSATTGQVATVATYTLAGYNLTPNAPVNISSNNAAVLVSTTGTAGSFGPAASVMTTASGTLMQTISVQFTAPATAGTTTAAISNSGSGLTASVAVTGAAIMAYTWNGSSTSFNNASSWTPARTPPLGSSDVLLFDGSVTSAPTVVLDYTSPQTIGQLQFINNVTATLSTDGNRLLNVDNNLPGDDFVIQAGSTVTVTHSVATAPASTLTGLTIALTSTETAAIGGKLIFTGYAGVANGRHTLQATGTGAIQFLNGSLFQTTIEYSATPFGNASTNANSVVFRNGSRYEQAGGSSPFGTITVPITAFEPTSYFLFNVNGSSPSLSGRTYGTLAYNISGSSSPSGSDQLTIQGDLLIINGTVSVNVTGGVVLQGNVQISNAARLSFAPASASTVQFKGNSAQLLNSNGTVTSPITFGANATLQINNAAGVTLGLPITVPGVLQLTNGLLTTTAANSLTLAADATDGSNTSFVNGPVIRPVSATGSYTFPIGKSVSFRPLTLNVGAQSGTAYYRAEQFEGNPGQNVGSSGLTRVSIFRSYTITPFASAAGAANGAVMQPTGFSGTATLSFGSNDGVTDPAASTFVVGKRADSNQPWSNSGRSANTASTLTSGAFTTFSEFVLASTDPNPNPNPLPVVLTSFTAVRQVSGAVQVGWATASERHSAYFEVQRSLDGTTFATVAKVAANGTTTQGHTYVSLDQVAPATQLYYRLRQVDTDGTAAFSPVVTLAATEAAATLALYPNPAHDYLTVAAAAGEEVQVIDLAGRVLQTTTLPASGKLTVEALPAGTYLLRAPLGGQQRVLRFTKE